MFNIYYVVEIISKPFSLWEYALCSNANVIITIPSQHLSKIVGLCYFTLVRVCTATEVRLDTVRILNILFGS
jgi:hypothetical protein